MSDSKDFADDLRAALAGETDAEDVEQEQPEDAATEPDEREPADAEAAETAPEEAATEETAEAAAEVGEETTETPADDKPVTAPEHWSAEDKEFFGSLPDDKARSRVLDWRKSIERGAQQKFDEAAKTRREFEPIDQALAPFRDEMEAGGLSRSETVSTILSAWAALKHNPGQTIPAIVRQYGQQFAGTDQARQFIQQISSALGVEAAGGETAAKPDPVATRFRTLEQRLEGFERSQHQERERHHRQVVRSASTALQEFAEAKDEGGQLKHPHFDAVKRAMGGLMQAAQAEGSPIDIETAYQQALWARPDLREGLLQERQSAAAKAAEANRKAAVKKAKTASTPRTAGAAAAPETDDDSKIPFADALRKELAERSRSGARA